jgi:hypothetical protein
MEVAGVGVLTGWGRGLGALPHDARSAAAGRYVIGLGRPEYPGDRFRRVPRECLLGIAAVDELLRTMGRAGATLAGSDTALLYATASAYGPSNRLFIESAGRTLHFPYTAPSAVPAEVAIEFGLTGPYVNYIGGATATLDAIWYAGALLDRGACARALVLAVEALEECADLYRRGRWLAPGPLVEAAACALLVPGGPRCVYADDLPADDRLEERVGETFACGPLIALALRAGPPRALSGAWRGRRSALRWI